MESYTYYLLEDEKREGRNRRYIEVSGREYYRNYRNRGKKRKLLYYGKLEGGVRNVIFEADNDSAKDYIREKNRCDYVNRRDREFERRNLSVEEMEEILDNGEAGGRLYSSPEDIYIEKEIRMELRRAVMALSFEEQQIIILKYYLDRPYTNEKIAECQNMSLGKLKYRHLRIIRKLREKLLL